MRIIVVDSDKAFTTSLSQRCQKASAFCQVIPAIASAFVEIKKKPDDIDIVLIAKELAGAPDGLALAQMIRKDPKTADVPYVVMSSVWGKAEFAKHQKTEFGANAYFNKKSALTELEATIEAVTGFKFGAAAAPAKPAGGSAGSTMLNIKLEAASDVVNISEDVPSDISMSEPIALFVDDSQVPPPKPQAAKPTAPAAPAASAAPVVSAPAPAGPGTVEINLGAIDAAPAIESQPVTPAAPASGGSGGIDINLGGSFEVETSKSSKPVAAAAPTGKTGSIDLAAAVQSIVLPTSAPAAPAAPAVTVTAPVVSSDEPQVEGSLFAVDINAGDAPPEEAAAAAAAPAVAPVPAPVSVAAVEPSVVTTPDVGAGLEISLGGGEAAAPVAAAEPAVVAVTPGPAAEDLSMSAIDIGGVAAEAQEPVAVAVTADTGAVIEAVAPPSPPEPSLAVAAELAAAPAPEAPALVAPPAPTPEPAAPPVSEEEAAKDLPYLFAGGAAGLNAGPAANTKSVGPVPAPPGHGHHVAMPSVDGGGNEEIETLKKYLTMREQDVSVLTAQLTYAKEELGKCEDSIKRLTLENEDLFHQIADLKKKNNDIEQELAHASKNREGEVEQLRFEVKSKIDRIKFLEDRLNDSAQQYEKLKERVRLDIRKIRIREKELESKLEILKKDSETLISARENKILELKRKIDLLEFNYDTLQDKNDLEKQNVVKANEKIDRVLKVLKLAVGVIEAEGEHGADSDVAGASAGSGGARPGTKVA